MTGLSLLAHRVSVALMGAAVLAATAVGFGQSWAGLYGWAVDHGLADWKAMTFPAMVDLFIAVGELGLFVIALEGHRLTRHALTWFDLAAPAAITAAGWGVSLAFNVGHVDHQLSDQLTAAVPPIAAMLGLLVLLRTLHRIVARGVWDTDRQHAADLVEPSPDPGTDLSVLPAPDGYAVWDSIEPAPDPHQVQAASVFSDEVNAGQTPSIRRIKSTLKCGQDKAREVRAYLDVLANQ